MKIRLVAFAAFCSVALFFQSSPASVNESTSIHMSEEQEQTFVPNLMEGNVSVGGNVGASYSTYSGLIFQFNPTIEFFVANRFSIGGTVSSYFAKDFSSFGLGPAATYYFWHQDRWAGFVGAGLLMESTNWQNSYADVRTIGYKGQFKIGSTYFINPSVSVGPVLSLTKSIGEPRSPGEDFGNLMIQFNIHL